MQTNYEVPRVEVPGLTDEDRAKIADMHEEIDWFNRTKYGFLRALLLKGVKPFTGVAKPAKKPTKHQRHMASVKARSAYLKSQET